MTSSVYYVPGLQAFTIDRITQSSDGSWGDPTEITINGQAASNFDAVDPDVIVLPNGTYLLSYATFSLASGSTAAGVPIYTAISTDGINFTNAQPAFTIPSTQEVSDPAIVQLANGSFLMSVGNLANPHGGVSFYVSQNGQNYTSTGVTLTQSDISPDMVLLSDGDVRLFSTGPGGIISFISADDGHTWTQESGVRLPEADGGLVSVVQAGPNAWDMVYQQPINPGGPNQPSNDELTLATSTDGLNFTVAQTGFFAPASSADPVITPAYFPPQAPTVSSISAASPDGTTSAMTSQIVTITLNLSEAATVIGTPTLQLNDNEVATYASGSGTDTLAFTYMVKSADISPDLQVTGLNLPTGASIADSSGNQLTGSVTANLAIAANTTLFPFANNNDITEATYIGYFNRAGDPAGSSYWVEQLSSQSLSVTGMAASFAVQSETTATYPFLANQNPGTVETVTSPNGWSLSVPTNIYNFINAVYTDLFGRSALVDSGSAGLAYWTNQLQTNTGNAQAVGSFIYNVISGAGGADQLTIANKVTVADFFTAKLSESGLSFTSSPDALAHSSIASVTSALSSVLNAKSTINAYFAAPPSGAEVAVVGTSPTSALASMH